ncbi:SubName: Full=Uncharacterized protein {ECO:0000313/EMBL:CCA69528.1} [Serendipita indica DSM 11827]|nr:SubName: Full=Uncharacterized protein {ECO:0000313/EMBL:CCA69528.1} [Serendipita indica DSM 11827]
MLSLLVLAGVFASAAAKPCVGFDANWGLGGNINIDKDRKTYQNSLYVLNADTTQPSNIHIFSFDAQAWSTQKVSADGTDPNSLLAILDRNTNVFFALSNSQLYSLDMASLTQSDGGTRGWQFVQAPAFAQNNAYPKPVMALAENHIHFLNVGKPATADIFVIHFSYMQPEQQVFAPIEDGGAGAPSTTGHTASIFKGVDAVQTKFAFVPDDGAATWVFDVISNTTQTLKGPTDKSTLMIAASQREIVQMTTSGDVYWMPYNPEDAQANYGANWSRIALNLTTPTPATGNSSSQPSSGPTSSGAATTTTTGAPSGSRLSAVLHSGVAALGLSLTGLWILF